MTACSVSQLTLATEKYPQSDYVPQPKTSHIPIMLGIRTSELGNILCNASTEIGIMFLCACQFDAVLVYRVWELMLFNLLFILVLEARACLGEI